MGITIHYRGKMDDLERVEDFEDRVIDLALALGGMAQIWRSAADDDPSRVVRGLTLNLAPGQETTSLLISPEGWLIGLTDIEDAERGRLAEPPYCFVKTQFGPLEGHVALVELLTVLKQEFFSNLEVEDEGGYWETRDLAELTKKHTFLQQAIEGLAEGLRRHGLSREAAEDPEILIKRIERIAQQVHRTLRRPPEHPPVTFDDAPDFAIDADRTEAQWDEMFRHNRRQQERMHRALEERIQRGESPETAFENAMRDIGLTVPGDAPLLEEDDEEVEEVEEEDDEEEEEDVLEGERLLKELLEEDEAGPFASDSDEDDEDFEIQPDGSARPRHPLMQRAMDLLHRLHETFNGIDRRFEQALAALFQGAGDMFGGLAQATSSHREDDEDPDFLGLRIVQLKRALRGVAFARGGLFPLRAACDEATFQELQTTLKQMEQDIFQELSRRRSALRQEQPPE